MCTILLALFIRHSIHENIQYFLSELCMAAFLNPENGDLVEEFKCKMPKLLKSWLHFSINPSPLLKYKR